MLTKKISGLWFKKATFHLAPLFLLGAILLYLNLTRIGLPRDVNYSPVFSLRKIVNSFFWYIGWGLGLPDMLVDFVGPGIKLNPKLMLWWGSYFKIIFSVFFLVVLIILLSGFIFFLKTE